MPDINQDDIDKLLAEAMGGETLPGDAPATPPPASPPPEPEASGAASQDDIDAMFANLGGEELGNATADSSGDTRVVEADSQDDIDELFNSIAGAAPEDDTAPIEAAAPGDTDLDADLGNLIGDLYKSDGSAAAGDTDGDPLGSLLDSIAGPPAPSSETGEDTVHVDTADMDELLHRIGGSIPEQPQAAPSDTVLLDAGKIVEPGPPPPPPVAVPPSAPMPPPARPAAGGPDPLSVFTGAGDVENMAGQIAGILGQLSEKARNYMQAWMTSDREAKELRSRLLAEERRLVQANGETDSLRAEIESIRRRLGQTEGEKIALEEARRTADASTQVKAREMESRITVLGAEVDALKEELTRARNQSTGADIESRRARFEADRMRGEIESERMERLRLQRALENREKELQAVQAQSSGQASALFLDELHRLVRRLENELEVRSSGANEALNQLDRLEVPENMVPIKSNLRAALMRAIGSAEDDDALRSLGREASGVRGEKAVEAARTDISAFETALSTYNLSGALETAGALLRDGKTGVNSLMRRIYQCSALRRDETVEHLPELARLLEGLRTVQESSDRARGRETGESELFYVQMFDFLHNLVRLKLVTRMSGEIWRLFLDLRGRFSFVVSDKQWTDYRDNVLNSKK